MSASDPIQRIIDEVKSGIIDEVKSVIDDVKSGFNQVNHRLDQLTFDVNQLVEEMIPSNPNIFLQKRNPIIVSPELPFNQPLPSTFTVVGIKKSESDGSTDRRIVGSKHCCLRIMLDPRQKIKGKYVVFAELNDRILTCHVTRIGLLDPSRGNIKVECRDGSLSAEPVQDDPTNDIVIVKVKEEFREAKYVPVMPGITRNDFKSIEKNKVYDDVVCFGRSLHTNVSSHYGLSFNIDETRGTGLMNYVVSRAERGNSGTVMHAYQRSTGMERAVAVGILRGLDTDHGTFNRQESKFREHYYSRGVAVICPTLEHFKDFEVLNEDQCVRVLEQGKRVEAFVGCSQNNQTIEMKSVELRVQPGTNIVEMTDQIGNKSKGVLFLSDAMIPYASQVSFDQDKCGHTFALG